MHRERWDTAAADSLCVEMALCGPWAILEISPVRPETNTASDVTLAHQLRVGGSSKCQLVFVDEKSRRALLEPLPFPVWRKHTSLPKRKLAGKPSHHTWKTSSLSSHSLLGPAGGSRSRVSECVWDLFGWVCVSNTRYMLKWDVKRVSLKCCVHRSASQHTSVRLCVSDCENHQLWRISWGLIHQSDSTQCLCHHNHTIFA